MIINLLLPLILLFYSLFVFAEVERVNYYCHISLLPTKKEVPVNQLSNYIQTFFFEDKGNSSGVKSKYKEYEALLWNQNNHLNLELKDEVKKIESFAKLPLGTHTILLSLKREGGASVSCVTQKFWEGIEDETEKLLYPVPLTPTSDLSKYKTRIKFILSKQLTIPYKDGDELGDKMKEIYFQRGKMISGQAKEGKESWCLFQLQRKLDQDLTLEKGSGIPLLAVSEIKGDQKVLNYHFVDFASGKKGYDHSEWAPFMFKCKLSSGTTLTYQLFTEITGGYFELKAERSY